MRHAKRCLLGGLSIICLGAAAMVPAVAGPFAVPAITAPASTEHLVGKVIGSTLRPPIPRAPKSFTMACSVGIFGSITPTVRTMRSP